METTTKGLGFGRVRRAWEGCWVHCMDVRGTSQVLATLDTSCQGLSRRVMGPGILSPLSR